MSKKHNTIFGTTEKSNFILNMKMSTTYKIEKILLVISVALIILGGAVWLFSGQKSNYIGMGFLACGAFASGLWYAISVWKTRTPILKNKSFFIITALALIAILSTLDSWSKIQSLYGNSGRFEGIIALLSYLLLFLGATIIYEKKSVSLILDAVVIAGVANALMLEQVMRFNADESPVKMGTFSQYDHPHTLSRYAEIADYLDIKGKNDNEKLEGLIKKVNELRAKVGIKPTIKDYVPDEAAFLERLDDMSEQAFDDQCTGANPRYPLIKEIKQMYLNAYYGKND